MNSLIDT